MPSSGPVHLLPATVKRAASASHRFNKHAQLGLVSLTLFNREEGGVSRLLIQRSDMLSPGFTYILQPSRGRRQPSIQRRDLLSSARPGFHLQAATVKRAASVIDSTKRHPHLGPARVSLTLCNRQEGQRQPSIHEEHAPAPAGFTYFHSGKKWIGRCENSRQAHCNPDGPSICHRTIHFRITNH